MMVHYNHTYPFSATIQCVWFLKCGCRKFGVCHTHHHGSITGRKLKNTAVFTSLHAKFGRRREHARGAPNRHNLKPVRPYPGIDSLSVFYDRPRLKNRGLSFPYS